MKHCTVPAPGDHRARIVTQGLLVMFSFLVGLSVAARTSAFPTEGKRSAVGKRASPEVMLLSRESPGKPWQIVANQAPVFTDDMLVGLPGASVMTDQGTVRLTFLSDLEGRSPYPVKEAAVKLHPSEGRDLDFTLDRGRVDVANEKAHGSAKVRVHVHQETFDLTLDPGSQVALELYGRWLPGAPFRLHPKPGEGPLADLVILVLKGEADLQHGSVEFGLRAPPGPALMEWDSVNGLDTNPTVLKQLPPWARADAAQTAVGNVKRAVLQAFQESVTQKGLDVTLTDYLKSDDPRQRRLAVFAIAALDELPRLGEILANAKHPDVWDDTVLALRHWIGRGPGQDQKLYEGLRKLGHLSRMQAVIVLQLLHSFSEEQLARPETYELLITLLGSERLGIRGLAYWHLSRLVPAGKKIGYNPYASREERERAIQEWKKLIPPGHLPSPQDRKAAA